MKATMFRAIAFSLSILFFSTGTIYGQYDERDNHPYDYNPFPGNPPGDTDPAPIDDYLPLLLIAGLTLAYFVIRKRTEHFKKE